MLWNFPAFGTALAVDNRGRSRSDLPARAVSWDSMSRTVRFGTNFQKHAYFEKEGMQCKRFMTL